MAVLNRDLAPSQQTTVIYRSYGAIATGVTSPVALIEAPCQVVSGALKAFGLSGATVYSLNIYRINSAGATTIGLGATLTALSGVTFAQGISFTLGATVLLQAGDLLTLNSGVANTAVTDLHLTVITKALQDVKTFFGVQL